MAGGQALDLAAEASDRPLPQLAIQKLQAMKTGAMLRCSAEAGAIIAGATADDRAALSEYGRALGAAFQISDDILDAESDAATLGKRAGKDAGRNKATLVATLGVAGAKKSRARFIEQAEAALGAFGDRAAILIAAARFTATRDH
jgi:farnesyl diphosphate synthase